MKTIIEIIMYLSLVGLYILLINKCSNNALEKSLNIKSINNIFLLINIGLLTLIIFQRENLVLVVGTVLIVMLPKIVKSNRTAVELFYIGLTLNFYLFILRDIIKIIIRLLIYPNPILRTDLYLVMRNITNSEHMILSGIALLILILYYKMIKKVFEWMKYQNASVIMAYSTRILFIIYLSIEQTLYYQNILEVSRLLALIQVIVIDYLVIQYVKFVGNSKDKEIQIEVLHNLIDKQKDYHKKQLNELQHIRKFKHDYSSMVTGINYLVNTKQIDKLKKFLKDMNENINSHSAINPKKYSNDPLVDEIFSSQEEKIKNLNIQFEADIILPENIVLTELEICRVFSNALNNSIEACEKLSVDEKPYIKVTTHQKKIGTVVKMINNFTGNIEYSTKKIKTTKIDTKEHGLGINNIRAILNSRGGNVKINIDPEKKEFELLLFIPKEIPQNE